MTSERIPVALGDRSYEVLIGSGLMEHAGALISAALPHSRLAIVTDERVAELHLSSLRSSLGEFDTAPAEIIIPTGESSKSFNQLQTVVEAVLEARLERGDAVVALGGGVVGDLAGFAAAITRRGMNLVQIPTTLLAQVDSSVGGKTGINARHGKNLVGAFLQPALVLADTGLLDTLPRREFAAGYAEIVKYALIEDAPFFGWLERNWGLLFAGGAARTEAIARSVRGKARIVAADERETGERALLNLGHTFGHALEAACAYDSARLIHGEAVAIGLALAHDFSADQGLISPAEAERVHRHLRTVGLPTAIGDIPGPPLTADELMRHVAQDKKVKRGRLTFILSRGIGRSFIAADVDPDRVQAFVERQIGRGA